MQATAARWTGQRTRGGRWGLPFLSLLARSGPVGAVLLPWCLGWVALWFVLAAPAARRASFELADRLGRGGDLPRRAWFAWRHFYAYGLLLIERMALHAGQRDRFRIDSQGADAIRAALARGRGAVLVAAHLGNWEAMGHLLRRLGAPVTIVMSDAVAPAPGGAQEALEGGRSYRVLVTDGGPGAVSEILAALEQGHLVGLMGDRVLAGRGVRVPFLGGEVELPVGPYALAAAAGAPLFHVHALRVGRRRYRFRAWAQGVPVVRARPERDADLARAAGEFAARLEEALREHPEQWGNLFPFWLPPGPGPGPR